VAFGVACLSVVAARRWSLFANEHFAVVNKGKRSANQPLASRRIPTKYEYICFKTMLFSTKYFLKKLTVF
jgi:hypothetical protein